MFGDHARAAAPSAPGNLIVSCGLLAIPVNVYTGLDPANSVPRKTFTKDGHPVGSLSYDKETGQTLEAGAEVVKMVEHAEQLVELTDEEVEAAVGPPVKGTAEIIAFVPLASIGREYVVETVQQMRPAPIRSGRKKMPNPAGEKAFCLLMKAMETKQVAGLMRIPGRTSTRPAALLPDGRLMLLAWCDRVRQQLPMPEAPVSETELALAEKLIEGVGISTPVLIDEDAAKIRAYLDVKLKAGKAVPIEQREPEAPKAEVDLADLLAASLAALKEAS